jgi:hypothetical protein
VTADLIAFLRARLDEDEAAARDPQYVWATAWEIASPGRILAEVAVKRKLVDFLATTIGGDYIDDGEPEVASRVLEFLALPYADHPDYQESWKP